MRVPYMPWGSERMRCSYLPEQRRRINAFRPHFFTYCAESFVPSSLATRRRRCPCVGLSVGLAACGPASSRLPAKRKPARALSWPSSTEIPYDRDGWRSRCRSWLAGSSGAAGYASPGLGQSRSPGSRRVTSVRVRPGEHDFWQGPCCWPYRAPRLRPLVCGLNRPMPERAALRMALRRQSEMMSKGVGSRSSISLPKRRPVKPRRTAAGTACGGTRGAGQVTLSVCGLR